MSISVFGSWVVTLAFFFVIFLVGKYLQNRERSQKLTKKVEDALRREVRADGAQYGTRYGNPTEYERRIAVSKQL